MKNKQVGIKSKEDVSKQSFSKPGSVQPDFHQSSRVQHYRDIGNQAVQRMLESRAIQAKLKIGSPNDKYEQEADRVAEQVTPLVQREELEEEKEEEPIQTKLMGTDQLQRQEIPEEEEEEELKTKPLLQRQVDEEKEEDEEEKPVLKKAAPGSTPEVSSGIESSINAMKGGGQPLSDSTRSFFEPRFGADFSQVRVHTDPRAAQTTQAINAKAFTTGKDIIFNSGQYSPGTTSGKHLLAHELTHVVQQDSTLRRDISLTYATNYASTLQRQTKRKLKRKRYIQYYSPKSMKQFMKRYAPAYTSLLNGAQEYIQTNLTKIEVLAEAIQKIYDEIYKEVHADAENGKPEDQSKLIPMDEIKSRLLNKTEKVFGKQILKAAGKNVWQHVKEVFKDPNFKDFFELSTYILVASAFVWKVKDVDMKFAEFKSRKLVNLNIPGFEKDFELSENVTFYIQVDKFEWDKSKKSWGVEGKAWVTKRF